MSSFHSFVSPFCPSVTLVSEEGGVKVSCRHPPTRHHHLFTLSFHSLFALLFSLKLSEKFFSTSKEIKVKETAKTSSLSFKGSREKEIDHDSFVFSAFLFLTFP